MTKALDGLGQKIIEWAVVACLVGVIGYLVGNSDATVMKAEISGLKATVERHEREIVALEALRPRVERLDARIEMEREERLKGDSQ
jgi:hypothetical protein